MHIINKKNILFLLFLIVMFLSQFRMDARQGYLFLPLEISLGCLFWIWNSEKKQIPVNAVLLYGIFSLYRVFITFVMGENIFDNVKKVIYYEIGLLFVCYMFVNKKSCIYIITLLRNSGFFLSILGCYEFVTKSNIFAKFITVESNIYMQSLLGTSDARASVIFLHPIICGVYETVFWLCTLFYPYKKSWMNYLSKTVILIALLGTQSRSSWISFFIVNILYLWVKRGRKSSIKKRGFFTKISFGVIATVAIMVNWKKIYLELNVLVNRLLAAFDTTHLGNYNRVTMIKMGINEWIRAGFVEKLFGYGNGYSISYLKAYAIGGWNTAVDNQYLTLLLDNGLIGLTMFILLAIRALKKVTCSSNRLNKLSGCVVLSILISAFFYEMLGWITVTFLLCLFLCMMEWQDDEVI